MGVLQAQFLTGFVLAGMVGFLSTQFLKSWTNIDKTHKQMFVYPPVPVPKKLAGGGDWGLGTRPDKSPLSVLFSGCLGIFINLLFSAVWLVVMLGVFFWLSSLSEIPPRSWVGVMYAGIVGVIGNGMRKNWKKMGNLYKRIINPPNPALTYPEPPNSFLIGANPALPAFSVVVNSGIELVGRALLMVGLLVSLYFTLASAYYFMMYGTIWEPPAGQTFLV